MISAYLKRHPEALRDPDRRLYPPAADRAAWAGILPEARGEIRKLAEQYARIPYPLRTATGFLAFVRNGSRQADEQPYFTRRRKLCVSLLNACAFPGESLDEVTDGAWMICEESSWVISAHNVNPIPGAPAAAEYPLPDIRKPYIDLFSAQTGMILSLTASLLERELKEISGEITRRIAGEIRQRILTPFMATDDFWWMGVKRKDLNNWTPWILSNILVCAALSPMDGEELGKLITRACEMMDRYLDVLPEDGGCDEGAGYWNMAGGALLDFLALLDQMTHGRLAFWEQPKIRNILSYPVKAELGGGWFVNFADCDARPFISGERMETAGRKLGDPALTALGTKMRGSIADQLNDVPHLTRALDLLFHPPAETGGAAPAGSRDVWLPDLQVRVAEKGEWLLACKGGHNGENHNHNDVGTFILFQAGRPVIVDAGNMVYTAKTFSAERYTLWNVRGAYHNLPIVGGQEQREGKEHAASQVQAGPDGLALQMEKAYGAEAGIRRLRRSFALSPEGLTLTDEGETESPRRITWVFMLRERPEGGDGEIRTGNCRICYPAELQFRAEEIPVTDPRMARNWPGSLWRVTLESGEIRTFRMRFAFTEAAGS